MSNQSSFMMQYRMKLQQMLLAFSERQLVGHSSWEQASRTFFHQERSLYFVGDEVDFASFGAVDFFLFEIFLIIVAKEVMAFEMVL
jgi:hypothetical protein